MKDSLYFLQKSEENMPSLFTREVRLPVRKSKLKMGDSFVLDLGDHCVGHFSFRFDVSDDFISAPIRLIIRFGEDMREIEDDFTSFHGSISAVWLQEEVLVLDHPQEVNMPRRYSCRYIKITVENARRPLELFQFCFRATTSADMTKLCPSTTSDPLLAQIDAVGTKTLKECMQRFLEDGPKRDRRLWIGDLRLEALTNYYTFQNSEVVKRCLYLIAAGERDALGFVPSYIYETPYFFSGRTHIADYALLFVTAVCDYFEHTQDVDTVNDLLALCKLQLDSFYAILDERGIVTPQKGWFFFIDWCPDLKGRIALQGVYLYTLERFAALLDALGDGDREKYETRLHKGRTASLTHLFDAERGIFVNDLDHGQVSVHSQVWMILGGVIDGEVAKRALSLTQNDPQAKQPFTPYMRHYVIEAMMKLGMQDEAVAYLKEIWGGMIQKGADTFWEVYAPNDPDFSPYSDRKVNSLCHAWSCTPSYFIRKYNL